MIQGIQPQGDDSLVRGAVEEGKADVQRQINGKLRQKKPADRPKANPNQRQKDQRQQEKERDEMTQAHRARVLPYRAEQHVPVLEPLFESKTDFWIEREMAKRLGYGDVVPQTQEQLARYQLDNSTDEAVKGITLEEPIRRSDIFVRPEVVAFAKKYNDGKLMRQAIYESKADKEYHDAIEAFDRQDFDAFLKNFFLAIHSRYDIERPEVQRYIRRKLGIINQLK